MITSYFIHRGLIMGKSLAGKRFLITGASSGIGEAAARALGSRGAKLIITGRAASTQNLAREIGADFYLVDFSNLEEVQSFATVVNEKYQVLDGLINNVGGLFQERKLSTDGHELNFQVNYLAGFLLTQMLQRKLEESKGIVINTSSEAHRYARLNLEDLENQENYKGFRAYGAAKMMTILQAMELNRRFTDVSAYSFHPGMVKTQFSREGGFILKTLYQSFLKNLLMISPEEAIDTMLWILETPREQLVPGAYYYKRKLRTPHRSLDTNLGQQLWERSLGILAKRSHS
jgi:NAD(P)-dependent dehydrogenase (short-subunit alcohol dehydrogenase family)